jgi:enoyl reductase-like protein
MGIINDGTYYFDETFEVKEDYELTLRHFTERGITVRSNILFMQHEHTQLRGGCRDSNRIEKEKSAVKRLITMYPNMIKEAKHRGTQFAIQLNL